MFTPITISKYTACSLNPPPDDRATLRDFTNLLIVLWINQIRGNKRGIRPNRLRQTETKKRAGREAQKKTGGRRVGIGKKGREVKAGYKWRPKKVWEEEMKGAENRKRMERM